LIKNLIFLLNFGLTYSSYPYFLEVRNFKTGFILELNSFFKILFNKIEIIQYEVASLNPLNKSYYRSDIQRWKKSCTDRKLPFYYTGEKGAYILEIE